MMVEDKTVSPAVPALADILREQPHDDRARGEFILALKSWAVRDLAAKVRQRYDAVVRPRIERTAGRPLSDTSIEDRKQVKDELGRDPVFRLWSKLSYEAQGMKWQFVDRLIHDNLDRLQSASDRYLCGDSNQGSLELHPEMPLPTHIRNHEIHRQPRGFCFEYHDRDISAGALYNIGALIGPSIAAGRKPLNHGRTAGDYLCELVCERYPDFAARDILEIGCGTGRNTPAYKLHFPEATVRAVDCAAGLLRWAFVSAEQRGLPIHFAQMDITALNFAEGSMDLVASHIVGHETTRKSLPKMIAEAWRVLRPGGVMFHMDVAIQRGYIGLCDQVLNDFQVRHNGEPFWTGWIDADIPALMAEAGIPEDCSFVGYHGPKERGAPWYCYGARKPL